MAFKAFSFSKENLRYKDDQRGLCFLCAQPAIRRKKQSDKNLIKLMDNKFKWWWVINSPMEKVNTNLGIGLVCRNFRFENPPFGPKSNLLAWKKSVKTEGSPSCNDYINIKNV